MMKLIVLTFICGFFSEVQTQTGANPAEKAANDLVTDFCTADIYYESIESEVKRWAVEAAVEAKKHANEAQTLALASEVYRNTNKANGYAVLAAIARSNANRQAEAAETTTKAMTETVSVISRMRAQISAFHGLSEHKPAADNIVHETAAGQNSVLTNGNKQRKCSATITRATPGAATCPTAEPTASKLRSIATALSGAKTIKTILQAKTKLATVKVAFEGVGNLGTESGWRVHATPTHCEDAGSENAAASATNAIAVTGLTESYSVTFDEASVGELSDSHPPQETQSSTDRRAYFLSEKQLTDGIRTAQNAQITEIPLLETETIDNIASTEAAAALYDFITGQANSRSAKKAETGKVAKLIFGKATGSINDDFIKPLSRDKLSIPTSGKPIESSTQKLAQENFDTAMVYYFSLNAKTAAAASPGIKPDGDTKADTTDKTGEKKDGDKETVTECSATEENKCDKNKCT